MENLALLPKNEALAQFRKTLDTTTYNSLCKSSEKQEDIETLLIKQDYSKTIVRKKFESIHAIPTIPAVEIYTRVKNNKVDVFTFHEIQRMNSKLKSENYKGYSYIQLENLNELETFTKTYLQILNNYSENNTLESIALGSMCGGIGIGLLGLITLPVGGAGLIVGSIAGGGVLVGGILSGRYSIKQNQQYEEMTANLKQYKNRSISGKTAIYRALYSDFMS